MVVHARLDGRVSGLNFNLHSWLIVTGSGNFSHDFSISPRGDIRYSLANLYGTLCPEFRTVDRDARVGTAHRIGNAIDRGAVAGTAVMKLFDPRIESCFDGWTVDQSASVGVQKRVASAFAASVRCLLAAPLLVRIMVAPYISAALLVVPLTNVLTTSHRSVTDLGHSAIVIS